MKKLALIFIALIANLTVRAEAFCHVRTFDEDDGLSQRLVKGIVQDRDGLIWIATWNGLNRFDGSEFTTIRPTITDDAYRYSSRIGDIKPSPDGNLLLRIDERLMGFDVRSHKFSDLQNEIETNLGKSFRLKNIMPTEGDDVVLETMDGEFIWLIDGRADGRIETSASKPKLKYYSTANRKLHDVGPYSYDDVVLSRKDPSGRIWLITRDGKIVTAPVLDGPLTEIGEIGKFIGPLYYATTDRQGNVWLRSSSGIHRVTTGELPYRQLTPAIPSMARVSFRDQLGQVWISESDADAVAVYNSDMTERRYLTSDGRLSDGFAPFGTGVYSISETPDGSMWLGTKPDGLFRIKAGHVDQFKNDKNDPTSLPGDNIYDILPDSKGRLWIATMGGGIAVTENPLADRPVFRRLKEIKGYPAEAKSVRHLIIAGDTMLIAATTSGLLAIEIKSTVSGDSLRCGLMVSEPGNPTSLGNVAVMDVAMLPDGRIMAATESDGLNIAVAAEPDRPEHWKFAHYNSDSSLADVALSVGLHEAENPLIVSNKRVYSYDPQTGTSEVFGSWLWGRKMRFSDGRPLWLGANRWLVGGDDGAIVFSTATTDSLEFKAPVMFTRISIENRPDTLLSIATDTIVLGKYERNLTLHFSALDYSSASLRYSIRLNDEEWTETGSNRTLTLLDLTPGTYTIQARASLPSGRWVDNAATLTVIVTPRFWETTTAKVLYILISLLIIGGIAWIVVYIRAIKRKQHETLQAYLNLLSRPVQEEPSAPTELPEIKPEEAAITALPISDEDRRMMDRVMEFVNGRISDSEITVDDMAESLSMSRSSLNRKVKSLTGLTPAEFLRESRLSQAARLLTTTDRPIKEIAFDCGFSDLNYFGKCFKASRGVTPSAYRKNGNEQ